MHLPVSSRQTKNDIDNSKSKSYNYVYSWAFTTNCLCFEFRIGRWTWTLSTSELNSFATLSSIPIPTPIPTFGFPLVHFRKRNCNHSRSLKHHLTLTVVLSYHGVRYTPLHLRQMDYKYSLLVIWCRKIKLWILLDSKDSQKALCSMSWLQLVCRTWVRTGNGKQNKTDPKPGFALLNGFSTFLLPNCLRIIRHVNIYKKYIIWAGQKTISFRWVRTFSSLWLFKITIYYILKNKFKQLLTS